MHIGAPIPLPAMKKGNLGWQRHDLLSSSRPCPQRC